MRWDWRAIGAIGSLLAGVAAVAALVLTRPTTAPASTAPLAASTAFYVDGCEQRIRAINLRAAGRTQGGEPALDFSAPDDWCGCTARVLESNFDQETVRGVGEWFQAVALGGAERSAEEDYFASLPVAHRRRVESAYDFATRQCNQRG